MRPAPALPEAEGAALTAVGAAVPLLGAVGSVAVVVSTGHGSVQGWLMAGGVMLASSAFAAATLWRTRAVRDDRIRRGRLAHGAHLDELRRTVLSAARRQRDDSLRRHPDPLALASGAARVDGRRRGGSDHLLVRYGVTDAPLELTLQVADPPPEQDTDPVAQHALDRFLVTHTRVGGVPAVLRLERGGVVRVQGPAEAARALVRALVGQAVAAHDPRGLAVALVAPPGRRPEWEWLKWLPHVRADGGAARPTDLGPRHLVVDHPDGLEDLLGRAVGAASGRDADARVLVVVDDATAVGPPPPGPVGRATYLVLGADRGQDHPGAHRPPVDHLSTAAEETVLVVADAGPRAGAVTVVELVTPSGVRERAVADGLDLTCADALARRVPPWEAEPPDARAEDDLARLLHLDAHGRPRVCVDRTGDPRLQVELGRSPDGRHVVLDLEEAALGGAGPHGLVIGATGSGKSELLRTLLLGLVTAHRPDRLNLLLVDFKGGATFTGLRDLPHVSAVITNLADDLGLVDRMRDALDGELHRRQELLGAAGGLASRQAYEAARLAGRPDLPPLPSLLVVVDEFSELLSARPELVDLFVTVGRVGRSLGLHLLLAAQRLEEGRLRGLDSHLSYRVALRTFSATESRAVIGTAQAHELPTTPGVGFLRTGPDAPVRFTTTYVSGPAGASRRLQGMQADAPPPTRAAAPADRPEVRPFRLHPLEPGTSPEPTVVGAGRQGPAAGTGPSVLEVVVDRLRGSSPRARPVWLPPPDRSPSLGSLLPDLARVDGQGLTSPSWRARGRLTVPLGVVDRPRQQRYDVLTADLSGEAGHVAVVGAPRSGRSTTLATLVGALALTHSPQELRVHVLDFGGGALAPLADLPHVAAVAGRAQPELVRRVVAEVRAVADAREAGAGHDRAEVLLVVDQWATLRSDFPELEPVLTELAQRGLSHGVHLALATTRWADLRPALRDVLGTRVELRLGDPLDSEVDRRQAARVPLGRPGRALSVGGHHALVARPQLADDPGPCTDDGLAGLVAAVHDAWDGPVPTRLRVLPSLVRLDEVRRHPALGTEDRQLLLGLDSTGLSPVGLDLTQDPHLLVLGESRAGRTATVRTLLREIARRHRPAQAQVFLVDPRRGLLGELDDDLCADRASTGDDAARLVRELAAALRERLPGPGVTAAQLRDRSWWSGAAAFLVVDDADLLPGAAFEPLVPLLPHARDVGLHVLLARRSAGLSRRPHPVVTALDDLDQPVLLLGGPGGPGDGRSPAGSLATATRPAAVVGRGRLTRRSGVTELQVAVADALA
ncbi:type VII secretion protein EccCa [Lapillicoccus jejuensis]|uniref:type VII secretion protein EccCa n=1 Tax=Lapillicoccus jejuensis TaxID=402171 RepID=UPI001476863F|nr:type VII secretion protein EccCa [Lapillicoccus jejuensis]